MTKGFAHDTRHFDVRRIGTVTSSHSIWSEHRGRSASPTDLSHCCMWSVESKLTHMSDHNGTSLRILIGNTPQANGKQLISHSDLTLSYSVEITCYAWTRKTRFNFLQEIFVPGRVSRLETALLYVKEVSDTTLDATGTEDTLPISRRTMILQSSRSEKMLVVITAVLQRESNVMRKR